MKIQVPSIELPAPVPTSAQTSNAPVVEPTLLAEPVKKPLGPEPEPVLITKKELPTLPAIVVGKQPDSAYEEPPVLILQDSRFVRLSSKEVKNLKLPRYLQLELDFSPLKEGETISADRNSSIRHAGKP